MKLPDSECAAVATSGWLTELEKQLFDGGPNLMIDDATVRMLIGALRYERKRSAELVSDLVNADRRFEAIATARDEACNRWEWFAQRFGRQHPYVDLDGFEYPRIAELRKVGVR